MLSSLTLGVGFSCDRVRQETPSVQSLLVMKDLPGNCASFSSLSVVVVDIDWLGWLK